jgi:NADPH2:quinone reductase
MPRRRRIWQRLADDLGPRHLDAIVSDVVSLDQLPVVFEQLLSGQHRGRTVVQLTRVD